MTECIPFIKISSNILIKKIILNSCVIIYFNKNYANVVGQGLIDKPVKDLTKTDIDFIKSTFPQAAETAKAIILGSYIIIFNNE